MFTPVEQWPEIHTFLTPGVPQPPEIGRETPEVLRDYVRRIQAALAILKERLEAYRPDALIIVGDDQSEVFSRAFLPALAIYTGEDVSGSTSIGPLGQKPEENHISLGCNAPLARVLLDGLLERGFDVTNLAELRPLSRPAAGLGHAFTRLANALGLHVSGIPVIPLFLNAYHPPMPSAARCYALGATLRRILADRPERVAILASGGLSHDPRGPRAGWVDEALDRWVLDRLATGEGHRLQSLFTFDSDTLRGGTGEIRSWITAAGAFARASATIVDYIPARHATTGIGFATWSVGEPAP